MAALVLAAATGCKATYPSERLTQAVEEVCRKEYKLSVTAERQGATLIAYASLPELLDENQNLAEPSLEKVYNVLTVLARVGMSTNAPIQFLTLVAADSEHEGVYLRITRHVYDIKRIFMSDFPHSESQARTEMEVSERFPEHLDVSLSDFLAHQLARRVEKGMKGPHFLQSAKGSYDGSRFLIRIEGAAPDKPLDQALDLRLKDLAMIVQGYGFKDFHEIVVETADGKNRLVWEKI